MLRLLESGVRIRYFDHHAAGEVPRHPYLLPDAPWSRRVIGSLANELAVAQPRRAHAVAKHAAGERLVVSVRAPIEAPGGANELCRRFGGAGRAAAGGIDGLPFDQFERFVAEFAAMRWGGQASADAPASRRGDAA